MNKVSRFSVLLTLIVMLTGTSTSFAADNVFRETFQDAFYGGAVGALVGAAFMVFTKKPADHLEDMGYGAAVGVLAGTTYGLARSARSLASIDSGKIKISIPTIIPNLVESPSTKQTSICWRANLLSGTFN